MIEVLNREKFDQLVSCSAVSFLGSSIYGITNQLFDNDYMLIGIKNEEKTIPFMLLKKSLKKFKGNHFVIYNPNTLSVSKILNEKEQKVLKKFLKKHNCLYFTIQSDGSESRNVKKNYYYLELRDNLIENFNLEIQSKINNSYKFPFNLIDVDITNIHHFCKLFSNISREKLTECMNQKEIKLKLVTLNIVEYIDNLMKQKNELLLKRAEEKLYDDKDDDIRIMELERKVSKIEKTISTLYQIKENRGDILYLSAGIYFEYNDSFIEYKVEDDKDFTELGGRYYLSFKMIKYAFKNNFKNYYSLNNENILDLTPIPVYESKDNIIKPFSYKRYKKREVKKHD